MIDLIIPTFKRLDKQITLNSIPESFRKEVTLVVQPQEEKQAREIHTNLFVLSGDNIGISQTRKEIAEEWGCNRNSRHWVLDDDLEILKSEMIDGKIVKTPVDDITFQECLDTIEETMDAGFYHGGIGSTLVNPIGKWPFTNNSRILGNVFYDGQALSETFKEIDWILDNAEDYYVCLQLLTRGVPNRVLYKFISNPGLSNSEGGCSTSRTIENHNIACKKLAEKFPEFVSIKTKVATSGPWKGLERLGVNGKWKKAYESSQKSSLMEFFNE